MKHIAKFLVFEVPTEYLVLDFPFFRLEFIPSF